MKFIANENIPFEVVQKLKNEGYEVLRVDEIKKGMRDDEIIQLSIKEEGILMTFDKDFGELVFKKKKQVYGIILLKFTPQNVDYIFGIIKKFLDQKIKIKGHFIVIEKEKVRIKKIKT